MREDHELSFEMTTQMIHSLFEDNHQLHFVQTIQKKDLDERDEMLLVLFCHLFANNSDDNIYFYDLDFLFEKSDWRRVKSDLRWGCHRLFNLKMIENANDNGMASREKFRMTDTAKTELLSEHFVEKEKKKAINGITDIEKDVYYPCISNLAKNKFTDVYTIKFNLHFREHREDDWIVENDSLWNGIKQQIEYVKGTDESVKITEEAYNALTDEQKAEYVRRAVEGTAEIAKVTINNNGTNSVKALTKDDSSDLLTFLNFTNDDVHYQKNKLKKSFLRLLYFDSMNPGNQNLLGYSTIFFDTGDMFAKYVRYIEEDNCYSVGADKKSFGKYKETGKYKTGIRVDRDIDGDDTIRLGSQFVVRSKNTSKASSEGFYVYIWKDNNSPLPQDLYMKVEFNHAGYGRTLPFMLPY